MATASAVEIKRAQEAARQADALEAIAQSLAAIEATQTAILDLLAPADADRPKRVAHRKD